MVQILLAQGELHQLKTENKSSDQRPEPQLAPSPWPAVTHLSQSTAVRREICTCVIFIVMSLRVPTASGGAKAHSRRKVPPHGEQSETCI